MLFILPYVFGAQVLFLERCDTNTQTLSFDKFYLTSKKVVKY